MRRTVTAFGLLVLGLVAGYVVNSTSALHAQAVIVTAVSAMDDNLAAVVIGGRVYTCAGVRSTQWTCRAVQLKLPE